MTQDISMPVSLVTLTQQLLEFVGPAYRGLAISSVIKQSLNPLTIDTTLTVSCARSLDMAAIMSASPKPSPPKPDSQKPLSEIFSRSTSVPFHLTYVGTDGWILNFEHSDTLLRLLEENAGSLAVGMIQQPPGKRLLMTLKVA